MDRRILLVVTAVTIVQMATVAAAPQNARDASTPVPIISQNSNVQPDGSFVSAFESGDGIKVEGEGQLKTLEVPPEDAADGEGSGTRQATIVVQRGQYSYFAPDGTPVSVQWTADEGGFHAQGSHLPVAPGV